MSKEKKVYVFSESLKRGTKGEELFAGLFPRLTKTDGKLFDFFDPVTKSNIELKSDYYSMATGNFFMERFSYNDKPGGPWQSLSNGADLFIYFYPKDKKYFVFELNNLVAELDELCKSMNLKEVINAGHITYGYLIKRDLLSHLFIDFI